MGYAIENVEIPRTVKERLENFACRPELGEKSVVLYSAGDLTRKVLEQLLVNPSGVVAIIDRNEALHGGRIAGVEIFGMEYLETHPVDVVLILSTRYHESIYLDLRKKFSHRNIEIVDACGEQPTYERFPGVTVDDFPAEALILSDFLRSDNVRVFNSLEALRAAYPSADDLLLSFESDEALSRVTRQLIDAGIRFRGYGNAHDTSWDASRTFEAPQGLCPHVMFKDNTIREAILRSRQHCAKWDISHHFDVRDFGNLLQFIRETRNVPGDYVEIGVYRGTSAVLASIYMLMTGDPRNIWLLDTYQGFTYAAAQSSSDAVWSGTHDNTSEQFVAGLIRDAGCSATIRKVNIIEDDLPREIGRISMVNIDVDIYEGIRDALAKVAPRVAPGGIIVCEDYGHTPGLAGAQLAVSEFLERKGNAFISLYFESGQLCLIKR